MIIVSSCADLTKEFEYILRLAPQKDSKHEDIVRFAMHTMMYRIADEFQGGKFRAEILEQFKDELLS